MNTPIYNAIREYCDSKPVPFHMPGHKLGRGLPREFTQNIAAMDLTEIPGTDNLHYPETVIKEAQELAAEAFGACESFFLVNGSTCGIHAMIMTVCKPGDKLIISRDCHKSVIGGMILAGAEPVYVKPEFDNHYGISTVIPPSEIERALVENPDAAGVLITRPNYYGICSDIGKIAEIVHSHNKLLLVDEAHGAHLKFGSKLPVCAMEAEADICVQSAHKTLTAFTQGAILHIGRGKVDTERLKFCLRLLQTTSPSYLIMASLDIARELMQNDGKQMLDNLMRNILRFTSEVCGNPELPLDILGRDGSVTGEMDGTRLVINVKRLGITGFEGERILRRDYGIQVEMSDLFNIVCISTIADSREYFDKLYAALCGMAKKFKGRAPLADKQITDMIIPRSLCSMKEVSLKKTRAVKLEDAAGRISSAIITPYPPGIPVVCPGEILLPETVEYIYNIINNGGIVNGLGENFEVSIVE